MGSGVIFVFEDLFLDGVGVYQVADFYTKKRAVSGALQIYKSTLTPWKTQETILGVMKQLEILVTYNTCCISCTLRHGTVTDSIAMGDMIIEVNVVKSTLGTMRV